MKPGMDKEHNALPDGWTYYVAQNSSETSLVLVGPNAEGACFSCQTGEARGLVLERLVADAGAEPK